MEIFKTIIPGGYTVKKSIISNGFPDQKTTIRNSYATRVTVILGITGIAGAALVGNIAAAVTFSGTLKVKKLLSGNIAADSTWSGTLKTYSQLSGNIAADSVWAGTLSTGDTTPAQLAGDIPADVSFAGLLTARQLMTGDIAADVVFAGTLKTKAVLTGDIPADTTFAGTLITKAQLVGDIPATATFDGVLKTKAQLSGDIPATGTFAGTLKTKAVLAGNIAADATFAGTLTTGGGSDLLDQLIGHWSLSDLTDAHGSNDLTNNGTVTFDTGKIGNAAEYVSNGQYLNRASNADLKTGNLDFTISVWVKSENLSGTQIICAKGTANAVGANDEYVLYYSGSQSRFRAFVADGAGNLGVLNADTIGAPTTATWYFIVFWHDAAANTVNIQVNNGAVDSVSYTQGGNPNGTDDFRVGWDSAYGYWVGKIDELEFRKKVLSADDRTALYNSGAGSAYPH